MSGQHHEYSPSTFPIWEKCMQYESDQSRNGKGSLADRGTLEHLGFKMIMDAGGDIEKVSPENWKWISETLEPEEVSKIEFAANRMVRILSQKGLTIDAVKTEQKLVIFSSDMTTSTGTGDVVVEGEDFVLIADYKGGKERDYDGQLKVYGLGAMQETGKKKVVVAVLYGMNRDSTENEFTFDECQLYFDEMIEKLKNKESADYCVNDYCSWCSKRIKCKERKKTMLALKDAVPEGKELTKGFYASTDITKMSPEKLGNLMSFSKLVSAWADDIKSLIETKLIQDPDSVQGWMMKEGSVRTSIDAEQAYKIAVEVKMINPAEFTKRVSITKEKLMELVYGDDAGKKASKDDFKETFASALMTGAQSKSSLVKKD